MVEPASPLARRVKKYCEHGTTAFMSTCGICADKVFHPKTGELAVLRATTEAQAQRIAELSGALRAREAVDVHEMECGVCKNRLSGGDDEPMCKEGNRLGHHAFDLQRRALSQPEAKGEVDG